MRLVGTGKSRLLDEFKWLALKVTIENSDLNKKIINSYVFKVDLENGTSSGTFDGPQLYRAYQGLVRSAGAVIITSPRTEHNPYFSVGQ